MSDLPESASPDAPQGAIDWGEVVAAVLDWAFALGELLFAVLAAGIVGGIVGNIADLLLAFFREDWAGYGRNVGWTVAAVSMAIAMPFGWNRDDDKKWSIPSPRKLRKSIATKARKRRKNAAYDFRSVGDVLQGTTALGLIGGVFGLMLGGLLMLGWFSLAMSPFASTEWFEKLEFQSAREFHDNTFRRHRDQDGIVVSADDPVIWQLLFLPVVSLGGAGGIFGMAYFGAQYVRYLVNVPADVRERQRKKKRRPVVEERQATAAAIEQRLQPLAPAPRKVPLKIRWLLLRDGDGALMLVGALFCIAGVIASVFLFFGWRSDPDKVPLVAVMFGTIFLVVGSVFLIPSFRNWRSKLAIMRHGYLARCRIATCQHPRTGFWKPYAAVLDELRVAWDKPIADSTPNANVRGVERFATFFGFASLVVFGFMGVVGVIMTVALAYTAIVEGELIGWLGLVFLALWWAFIVVMAKSFRRVIGLAANYGKQSLKTIGVKPVVECRIEFELPNGKTVDAKTKLDLSRHLESGRSGPDDVLAYDPWKPSKVLLLSGFIPTLAVGENGHWRLEMPA